MRSNQSRAELGSSGRLRRGAASLVDVVARGNSNDTLVLSDDLPAASALAPATPVDFGDR